MNSSPVDPDGDVLEFTAAVSNADVAVAWVDVRRVEWNPVNAFTMGRIVQDAGLTEEEFRNLL